MANNFLDSSLLDKALHFAINAHANTERRGKGFPYIIHPMEAVEIVSTITSDQELLAAAALHDTVEDTDVTVEQLRAEFGNRIAKIVEYESDKFTNGINERTSWHDRKEAAIKRIASAPYDVKIVAMGDKLSNMRAIARDYEKVGDELWKIFHAPNGKPDHEWHYRGLAASLFDLADTTAYKEFISLIEKTFGPVNYTEPELIDINDYEESGDGFTAISYNHKGGHSMIKLYNEFMPADEPIKELTTALKVMRMGISTPIPGRFVTDGKRFGSEYARILNKRSFARAISQNPEDLEKYARRFARMCKKFHSTPCNPSDFSSVVDFYHMIIAKSPIFKDDEKKRILKFVDSIPVELTCLHGDLHIGNIITTGTDNYWIDLADFRYGNHMFDLGMFYFVCKCNTDELTQKLYHISNEQISRVWDIFIEEYFGAHTTEKHAEIESQIKPFAALKMVHLSSLSTLPPNMIEFIRKSILS